MPKHQRHKRKKSPAKGRGGDPPAGTAKSPPAPEGKHRKKQLATKAAKKKHQTIASPPNKKQKGFTKDDEGNPKYRGLDKFPFSDKRFVALDPRIAIADPPGEKHIRIGGMISMGGFMSEEQEKRFKITMKKKGAYAYTFPFTSRVLLAEECKCLMIICNSFPFIYALNILMLQLFTTTQLRIRHTVPLYPGSAVAPTPLNPGSASRSHSTPDPLRLRTQPRIRFAFALTSGSASLYHSTPDPPAPRR